MIKFNCFNDMPLNQDQTEVNKELRLVAEGGIAENLLLFGGVGTGKSTLGHYLPRFYEAANGGTNPVVTLQAHAAAIEAAKEPAL